LLLLLSLTAQLLVRVGSKRQAATDVARHLIDDRLDQPLSGPASKSMSFPLPPRSSPNRCLLLRADRKPPHAAVAAEKRLHIDRHLRLWNRPADATVSTACAPNFSPSHEPVATTTGRCSPRCSPPVARPPPWSTFYGEFLLSPPPKIRPQAVGMHLGHFPHPLSPPATGIGRRHRRSCASGQGSPASPVSLRGWQPSPGWAGQKRPKCTVDFHNFQLN
jgi:hypothetical protein